MIQPGLLMWPLTTDKMFYVRFLNLLGLGYERVDDTSLGGIVILIGIWKFELGIHLGKRRGDYVKRIEDEKSPTASA